jgi:hypothetical protein
MKAHRRFLALAAVVVLLLAGLLLWRAIRGPVVPIGTQCSSVSSCEHLAGRLFGKDILVPVRATLVGGGYSREGLGIDFRLTKEDFDTVVFAAQLRCSASQTAPSGRRFCYFPFDNGCNAIFRNQGLTYFVSIVQDDVHNAAVPRLADAMTVVTSYGPG